MSSTLRLYPTESLIEISRVSCFKLVSWDVYKMPKKSLRATDLKRQASRSRLQFELSKFTLKCFKTEWNTEIWSNLSNTGKLWSQTVVNQVNKKKKLNDVVLGHFLKFPSIMMARNATLLTNWTNISGNYTMNSSVCNQITALSWPNHFTKMPAAS